MRPIKNWGMTFSLAALISVGLCACIPAGENIEVDYPDMPPLSKIVKMKPSFTPKSQRYKIAVLTFIDQTEKAGMVTDPIADILTTELFKTLRFDLYDRSDLTQKTLTITDESRKKEMDEDGELVSEKKTLTKEILGDTSDLTSKQYEKVEELVDGILVGYITSFEAGEESGQFEFDYRIVNAPAPPELHMDQLKKLIVFSGTGIVRFTTDPEHKSITFNREDIRVISDSIKIGFAGKYKELSDGNDIRITDLAGYKITINAGTKQNIRQGFAGYVVKPTKVGTFKYMAEFVIVNTFENASIGFITSPKITRGSVSKNAVVKIK